MLDGLDPRKWEDWVWRITWGCWRDGGPLWHSVMLLDQRGMVMGVGYDCGMRIYGGTLVGWQCYIVFV